MRSALGDVSTPTQRLARCGRRGGAAALLVVAVVAALLAPGGAASAQPSPTSPVNRSSETPVVQVPPGFTVEKVVGGLTYATAMTWDDEGRMYVVEAGGQFVEEPPPARLLRIEDGEAREVANLTEMGVQDSVVGLTFHDGAFFFTHRAQDRTGAVSRLTLDGGRRTELFSGIVDSQSEHQINGIGVGPDGRMYVAVGLAGNAAVMGLDNAPFIMRSPGVQARPCRDYVLTGRNFVTPDFRTEEKGDLARTGAFVPFGTPTEPGQVIPGVDKCGGSILAFDPANPEATLTPFVDGLRNVIGLGWNDQGEMFTTVNGYDIRGSRPVRDFFDGTYRVRQGTWYGYPDFSAAFEPLTNDKFDAPDSQMAPVFVGGEKQPPSLDFVIDHQASGLTPPDPALIAGLHEWNSSPSLFDVAPASWGEMAGRLFIAEWGDLAPPTNPLLNDPAGSQVVMVDPDTAKVVPFARNPKPGPASAQGATGRGLEHPFDVKFGPDGAMYIVDYGIARINPTLAPPYEFPPGTGSIWRITRSTQQTPPDPGSGQAPNLAGTVDLAADTDSRGYWLATEKGGVFAFGGADFYGSLGAARLAAPIVAIAATPTGDGYWLAAADGGVFAFGDARFFGSLGALRLNKPIVGMSATESGRGYWLVASDGGVFAFGDARFHGSLGDIRLNKPIVSMADMPSGDGYWLTASDGGVFAFGAAPFLGSLGSVPLVAPIVDMAAASSGGYWLTAEDGGVFAFGSAPFLGSTYTSGGRLQAPVVSIDRSLGGYYLASQGGEVRLFVR